MVEAGGIEPQPLGNQGLTTSGQNRTESGQTRSQGGQPALVEASAARPNRSNSGQGGATGGEKWNVPGASVDDADLLHVVAAWPQLRPELQAVIAPIVAAVD
jgi:hypothetical protein